MHRGVRLIGYNRYNLKDPYEEQPQKASHVGIAVNALLVLGIFLLLLLTV